MSRTLTVEALPGYPSEIGTWLWAMQEVRRRTLRLAEGLDQRTLDWEGADGRENAIGSLLYHIALVEMHWLYEDVMQRDDLPSTLKPDFPFGTREADGHLTRVLGVPLAEHVARLNRSREVFLEEFRAISPDEWRRLRRPYDFEKVKYAVTPEWAVFHLVEHEAGHGFQISSLKARARRLFGSSG